MKAKNLTFSYTILLCIFSIFIFSSCDSFSKGEKSNSDKDSSGLNNDSNLAEDNELAYLIGQQWVGDFSGYSITIQIKKVEPIGNGVYKASGFNTVVNTRPIDGTFKQEGEKVKFSLNEPGNNNLDGSFTGSIYPSEGMAMRGSFSAYKGNRTIGFSLENNNSNTVSSRKKEEIVEEARKSSQFYPTAECVVISKRSYFYSVPDYAYKTKAYLVEGDRISVEKIQRNFLFIAYYNEYSAQSTSGWVNCNDFEVIR